MTYIPPGYIAVTTKRAFDERLWEIGDLMYLSAGDFSIFADDITLVHAGSYCIHKKGESGAFRWAYNKPAELMFYKAWPIDNQDWPTIIKWAYDRYRYACTSVGITPLTYSKWSEPMDDHQWAVNAADYRRAMANRRK